MSKRACVVLLLAATACSHHDKSKHEPTHDAATPIGDASAEDAAGGSLVDAAASDGGSLDASDAMPPPRVLKGKIVLHAGDSMVGGQAGLTRALAAKFEAEGAKFVSDSDVSVSIASYDKGMRLKRLLDRYKPDIVILTLGANDVFVPYPESLTQNVEHIVKRIGARECYWMSPATWKPDSGIVAIIRDHAAPCGFYDSTHLTLPRVGDGIHPTDKGGAEWADDFWDFFRAQPAPDAAPSPSSSALLQPSPAKSAP